MSFSQLSDGSRERAPYITRRLSATRAPTGLLLILLLSAALPVRAESEPAIGGEAWLRYQRLDAPAADKRAVEVPAVVVSLSDSELLATARDELIRGLRGMLGRTLRAEQSLPKEDVILLATFDEVKRVLPTLEKLPKISGDGFWLKSVKTEGQNCLLIAAPSERGVLYGVFKLLGKVSLGEPLTALNERHSPAGPLRMVLHWDRLDGTVPGGSGDPSLFWDSDHLTEDLEPVRQYARMLASVGINSIAVNDPRAGGRFATSSSRKELARLNAVLRPWGIRLFLAVNSLIPPAADGKQSADVHAAERWRDFAEEIYRDLPEFGGFVLDADWAAGGDSEDATKKRAAAINSVAAAVQPHGGIVICRTCVCGFAVEGNNEGGEAHDPARVAYEIFQPLDGQLAENVVLQIKQGPTDFQVREPVSPLFGALEKTNQAMEVQLSQQHLGQQRHLCFLAPMWKQALEFNTYAEEKGAAVKELVGGKTFERPLGGLVAVSNARRTAHWFDHELALANLYSFGRLAWDPNLTGKQIAEEWIRLTFGHDPLVVGTLAEMLLKSWRTYENYTGSLGAGTFTDGESDYGPAIASAPSTGWVPWHGADATSIGKDRTAATGSGFVAQYRAPVAARFESLQTCPDELLLFMHRVPYTHKLKSGKTVIQHIYDAHYHGAREAERMQQRWEELRGRIAEPRFAAIAERLAYQAGHAQLWRDAVCTWFQHVSDIPDNEERVGNYPHRYEAEAMQLEGYEWQEVQPWETASGGRCARVIESSGNGALSMKYEGEGGWFNLSVRYFDENDGESKYRLLVGGQLVDEWAANDTLPDRKPNGHTSTRRQTRRVALRPDDEIRIEAIADDGERAAIDYLEIVRAE